MEVMAQTFLFESVFVGVHEAVGPVEEIVERLFFLGGGHANRD